MKNFRSYKSTLAILLTTILSFGCGGGGKPSISVQPSTESFSQGESFNLKLDILWVVDPSRSMFEETERVKLNIGSFMQDIVESGYEYRMGVVSTAAWSDLAYQQDNTKSYLRYNGQGVFNKLHRGECTDFSASQSANPYLNYLEESDLGSFLTKFDSYFDMYGAKINTSGCGLVGPPFGDYESVSGNFFADGRFTESDRSQIWQYANDERPLQSMQTFLSSSEASNFLREDAFLAVIMITDEPDGSRDNLTPSLSVDQSSGEIHSASRYLDFLDNLKGSRDKYSVYSIIKQDGSNQLDSDVASQSGGEIVNIDASSAEYKENLESIKNAILRDSSTYPISAADPVVDSFAIKIIKKNGTTVNVPKDNGSGGFKYLPGTNAIQFNAPFVPDKGDSIQVFYDKTSLASSGNSLPFIALSNNEVAENASAGTTVGSFEVGNTDEDQESITYTLLSDTSDPDGSGGSPGAFSLSSDGILKIENGGILDRESQALHSITVSASSDSIDTIERDVTIILKDVVDSLPIAQSDIYTRSEKIVDDNGIINVIGNVSFNDTGIDTSEAHTFSSSTTPNEGSLNLNASTGEFTYSVTQSALSLSSGQTHTENLSYTISDASGNDSTTSLTINIEGSNAAPILLQAFPDQNVEIEGGEVDVPINVASIGSSGLNGNADDLVDGNNGTTASTTAANGEAHFLTLPFSGSLYEISEININGDHDLGNMVFQVLAEDDRVLTREVLEINQGNNLNIPFTTAAIGSKVKILRPDGAVNQNTDQDIQVQDINIRGFQATTADIDLSQYFNDPDGDPLTYFLTDKYGEGQAPGWAYVDNGVLKLTPPGGADVEIGILAEDTSGDSVFDVFRVTRSGGATNINGAPIALLDIMDEQRGGLTLTRWGGEGVVANPINHSEMDDFLDLNIDEDGNVTDNPNDPALFEFWGSSEYSGAQNEIENGWTAEPSFEDNKFIREGRLIPADTGSVRRYGEFYSGYFVPAKTGIYRFKTTELDDVLRLLLAPSEYISDLTPVITGTHNATSMRRMMRTSTRYAEPLGPLVTYQTNSPYINNCEYNTSSTSGEFFPAGGANGKCGGPHVTSRFFINQQSGYKDGYVYLEKGNVYAFQLRFAEGGGNVAFDFEYDYKENAVSNWEGWKPIDASVLIPRDGSDGYAPRKIAAQTTVNYNASSIFYDAEQDALEYEAKLVLPDGSDFVGQNGTSEVSEIGLSFNISSGLLTGEVNAYYDGLSPKPRVQFKAKEKFSQDLKEALALPIKLDRQ